MRSKTSPSGLTAAERAVVEVIFDAPRSRTHLGYEARHAILVMLARRGLVTHTAARGYELTAAGRAGLAAAPDDGAEELARLRVELAARTAERDAATERAAALEIQRVSARADDRYARDRVLLLTQDLAAARDELMWTYVDRDGWAAACRWNAALAALALREGLACAEALRQTMAERAMAWLAHSEAFAHEAIAAARDARAAIAESRDALADARAIGERALAEGLAACEELRADASESCDYLALHALADAHDRELAEVTAAHAREQRAPREERDAAECRAIASARMVGEVMCDVGWTHALAAQAMREGLAACDALRAESLRHLTRAVNAETQRDRHSDEHADCGRVLERAIEQRDEASAAEHRLRRTLADADDVLASVRRTHERTEREHERALAALGRYGVHRRHCARVDWHGREGEASVFPCTCGLAAALESGT